MTTIKQLFADRPAGDVDIKIAGWVRTLRQSKNFSFVEVNDGTYFKNLQVVLSEGELDNYREAVKTGVGASIEVEGKPVSYTHLMCIRDRPNSWRGRTRWPSRRKTFPWSKATSCKKST